jgi:hypothetical protein
MKRFAPAVLFALSVAAGFPAAAQAKPDEAGMQALRSKVGADRRAVMKENLSLSEAEAKKFWPIYDAYLKDLAVVNRRQNRAILDYVNTESTLNDLQAKRIARELLAADEAEGKLRRGLHRKVEGVLPGKKAVRVLQIENKIRAVHDYDLAATFPLVK